MTECRQTFVKIKEAKLVEQACIKKTLLFRKQPSYKYKKKKFNGIKIRGKGLAEKKKKTKTKEKIKI